MFAIWLLPFACVWSQSNKSVQSTVFHSECMFVFPTPLNSSILQLARHARVRKTFFFWILFSHTQPDKAGKMKEHKVERDTDTLKEMGEIEKLKERGEEGDIQRNIHWRVLAACLDSLQLISHLGRYRTHTHVLTYTQQSRGQNIIKRIPSSVSLSTAEENRKCSA